MPLKGNTSQPANVTSTSDVLKEPAYVDIE